RLYAREASPSMHAYCTDVLHLSDAEAFLRIHAARAARAYPAILEMLADGRLHLSAIALLAPHLTRENHAVLLARATHKTKREVEEILAELVPRPDAPSLVRKLPQDVLPMMPLVSASQPPVEASELRPDGVSSSVTSARVEVLAPARYKVQFTASAEFRGKLLRLQALMRSRFPDGDLAQVLEDAVTEKLERLEARRYAKTVRPRTKVVPRDDGSRYVPAALRRAVALRDENRCRFVDARGRRCLERHRLEYHHRIPFGMGGGRTLGNIALMCRAHNQYLADHDYGRKKMERQRSAGKRPSATT
ncbi:MAG TPA: hypothetical protein VIC87_17060, partial [Vicinamibacteria bacterium]